MKTVIDRKKYDTNTAELIADYRNFHLRKYEEETGNTLLIPFDKPIEDIEPDETDDPKIPLPDPEEPEEDQKNMPLPLLDSEDQDSPLEPEVPPVKQEDDEDDEEDEEQPDPDDPGENEPDDPETEDPVEPSPDDELEEPEPKLSPFWECQQLYRKNNGKYFVYAIGGSGTNYFEHNRDTNFTGRIYVLRDEEQAIDWALEHFPVDEVEELFGVFSE